VNRTEQHSRKEIKTFGVRRNENLGVGTTSKGPTIEPEGLMGTGQRKKKVLTRLPPRKHRQEKAVERFKKKPGTSNPQAIND